MIIFETASMKLNRNYLFIIISSVALLTVLIIQVSWIFETARVKEELFNEKANMVLSKTAEALSLDKRTCMNLECGGIGGTRKVDSLFNHYMKLYNIRISYYFEVKPMFSPQGAWPQQAGAYTACVKEPANNSLLGQNGLRLKLVFPEKDQFILAEMDTIFITSVTLILVVLILSCRTILSLMKEKEISEHTTDFLNNMTHEFKTPLTNISLAGKMILKDPSQDNEEKIKHYSSIILEENEKLRLQVEQVLSMTALERGEIPLQKATLDVHALIHTALKCISIQAENKEGSIHLQLNATRHMVVGDSTHLANALCNLVDNSLKYSAEKPHISIGTHNNGQNLLITISDKGIGIDEKYHKKVFDKFFRVPTGDVHDVKGFGLGLAYVKKIVELHGGSIELHSEKGEGTTFVISLPHA